MLTKVEALPESVKHIRETDLDGSGSEGKPVPRYKAAAARSTPKITSHDPAQPH